MKQIKYFLFLTIISFLATSCSDDKKIPQEEAVIETSQFKNLYATQKGGRGAPVSGEFAKFSFAEGKPVTSDNWDVAFRGTTVIFNGGNKKEGVADEPERTGVAAVYLSTGKTMDKIDFVTDEMKMKQDAKDSYAVPTGSGNGWYTYDMSKHTISPIAGKVFVIKTHNGHYAKMEILSYYKDGVEDIMNGRYYTFNYVYNATKGNKELK